MRVGASRTAPDPKNLSATELHSPRLRNPNQLRRGERYPLHPSPTWGQSWTPIEGQSSTPIDSRIHAWATASLYGHAPEVQVSRWVCH